MAQSQLMQEALVFVERINLLRFLENSQPIFRSNVDRNLCNKFDGSGAWEKPRTGKDGRYMLEQSRTLQEVPSNRVFEAGCRSSSLLCNMRGV